MTGASNLLLVTGGSRGIGAATCRLAAAAGFDVVFSYRSEEAAAAAVAADIETAGRRALAVRADVGVEADVNQLFQAVDGVGRLTHFVNNAGIIGLANQLADSDAATVRACIDVNVTGAILAAQAAIRRMSTAKGGRGGVIVNVSSAAATLGAPGEFVWYAASKGAIDSLTIGLSKELGDQGIRVNGVAPGLIATDIHASAGRPERVERLKGGVPMGREGSAEEVAEAILFLLSDASSYVSGATLRVTGGR
jgi:NAD(P)-dependent dehydrogenase (short-subunit alcohol dehydrogenase family)